MEKVVNISLNGIAYQLEEPGYNQLRSYLERADARLKDSPDRAEIMADLEQAIGEKCRAVLGTHKTVVNIAEMERILQEMGPVQSAESTTGETSAEAGTSDSMASAHVGPSPRKRLFKIREGQMIMGVCNGLAAYINVDPTWVRIAAVLLTVFTSGVVFLIYIVLGFIIPYAETPEDRAAAFGMPFNTEELINRAKKNFEEFGEKYRWRREWRRQQRHWNRQFRHMNEQLRMAAAPGGPVATSMASAGNGVLVALAALLGGLLFIGLILAVWSLFTTHTLFGWDLPYGIPMWLAVIAVLMVYGALTSAISAMRSGGLAGHHPGMGAFRGLIGIGVVALVIWLAYSIIPGAREVIDSLMWAANLTATTIADTII